MSTTTNKAATKTSDIFTEQPHVVVVVLGYNEIAWLGRCLSSVLATRYDNFTVVFVDNASSDGSRELVADQFPAVHIVLNDRNLGYAGGNNSGIEYAFTLDPDCVVLLNPDTWVEPDWLNHLVDVFRDDPEIGVVTAMIRTYDSNTRLDTSCSQIFRTIPACLDDLWTDKLKPWYYTDTGSGAALMMSRKFLTTVGIIDPEFFIYFEEIDLLRRGRLHGFRLAISTTGIVHHFNRLEDPEQTRPTKIRFERGHMIFTLKNQNEPLIKSFIKFALEGPSRILGAVIGREWDRALKLTGAFVELLLKSPKIILRRHLEKRYPNRLPEMRWLKPGS
jgi:GT2 family glycosyltransferase